MGVGSLGAWRLTPAVFIAALLQLHCAGASEMREMEALTPVVPLIPSDPGPQLPYGSNEGTEALELGSGDESPTQNLIDTDESFQKLVAPAPAPAVPSDEKSQKLYRTIAKRNKKVEEEMNNVHGEITGMISGFGDGGEKRLKFQASKAMNDLKRMMKLQTPRVKTFREMQQLRTDALQQKQQVFFDIERRQRNAKRNAKESNDKAVKAAWDQKRSNFKSALIKTTFRNISMTAEIRDVDACIPYPSCLQTMQNAGECSDQYPTISCIRARRGKPNLCEVSAKVQQNCCGICLMDSRQLCIKERLILAGLGLNPNRTANLAEIKVFDAECSEASMKAFGDKDASQSAPFSPHFNQLVKNEYEAKYNGTNSSERLRDETDVLLSYPYKEGELDDSQVEELELE